MPDHSHTSAVVTGGTQGLGLAIVEQLIADGCGRVAIAGRSVAKGEEVAERLRKTGADVHFIATDMGDAQAAIALIDHAAARFGRLTALVNAAAATDRGSILDTSPEVWDALMDVNAKGPFFAIQRFAQRAVAEDHAASIVNVLSMVVHCGQSFLAP